MATLETWNGRTSTQTDADSPLDTTLMDGVRLDLDHLRQVLYGNNEGAGTYYTPVWGHTHNGTNSPFVASVADGAITPAKLSDVAVGDYSFHGNAAENSTISTSYVKLKETRLARGGAYRIKFDMYKAVGTAYGQIYRNGAAVGTERSTTSSTDVTFSEDISGWSSGDLLQIYGKVQAGSTCYINDLSLFVAASSLMDPYVNL